MAEPVGLDTFLNMWRGLLKQGQQQTDLAERAPRQAPQPTPSLGQQVATGALSGLETVFEPINKFFKAHGQAQLTESRLPVLFPEQGIQGEDVRDEPLPDFYRDLDPSLQKVASQQLKVRQTQERIREAKPLVEKEYEQLSLGEQLKWESGLIVGTIPISGIGAWNALAKAPTVLRVAGRVLVAPFAGAEKGVGLALKGVTAPVGKLLKKVLPQPQRSFVHYSERAGLTELDPAFFSGIRGEEGKIARTYPDLFTKRGYAYNIAHTKEAVLPNKLYVGQIPEAKVLNISTAQADALWTKAEKAAAKKGLAPGDELGIRELFFLEAKDAGYDAIDRGNEFGLWIFKKTKVKEIPVKDIDDIVNLHALPDEFGDQGVTFNIAGLGNMKGKPYYAVSVNPERTVILPKGEAIRREDAAGFISRNQDLLSKKENSFGSWFNKESGNVEYNVVRTLESKDEALKLARQHGQKAIYDLKNGKVIETFPNAPKPITDPLEAVRILPQEKYPEVYSAFDSARSILTRYNAIIAKGGSGAKVKIQLAKANDNAAALWGKAFSKEFADDAFRRVEDALDPAISKLVAAVRGSKKLIKDPELLTAQVEERIAIAKQAHALVEETGSLTAAATGRAGKRVTAEFSPLWEMLEPEEIALMHKYISITTNIPEAHIQTRINTWFALKDLLNGGHLVESQLKMLETAFGTKLGSALVKARRSMSDKVWRAFTDIVNTPKSIMASGDWSAPFRQNALFMWLHPKESFKAFVPMFRATFSPRYYDDLTRSIVSDPDYPLALKAKIQFTNIMSETSRFSSQEEIFASHIAERLPLGVGKVIRASERAYVGYLNKVRLDVFKAQVKLMRREGLNLSDSKNAFHLTDLAKLINWGTGRGSLGKYEKAAGLLNGFFFAPKLVASRFQFPLLMLPGFTKSKFVRKAARQAMIRFIGVNGAVLMLLDATGAIEVEKDPRSSNFAKIRVGNVFIDPWGGFQQVVRYAAQLATGQRKAGTGSLQEINRAETVERFIRSKTSPAAGAVWDFMDKQTFVGEKLEDFEDYGQVLLDMFTPFIAQDIYEAAKEEGAKGALLGATGAFGYGVVAYDTAKQGVGEVRYQQTYYQELQRQVRDALDEGDEKKALKIMNAHMDANWHMQDGKVFSRVYQEMGKANRELRKIQEQIEDVERDDSIPAHVKEDVLEALDQRMIEMAANALIMLEKLQFKYNQ